MSIVVSKESAKPQERMNAEHRVVLCRRIIIFPVKDLMIWIIIPHLKAQEIATASRVSKEWRQMIKSTPILIRTIERGRRKWMEDREQWERGIMRMMSM